MWLFKNLIKLVRTNFPLCIFLLKALIKLVIKWK